MATPFSFLRRLTLSILMPLLLLSQQGALLHELSHWHPVPVAVSTEAQVQSLDVDHDICLICLSFAQIGGLAKFDAPAVPKVDGLRYHFASEPVRSVAESSLPAARSRGPPTSV
jgi:hypothetical protein